MPHGSSGCWTCRVRHRKCGLEIPSCQECTDRHVHCHGYGPKPAWMDGGSEELRERSRIKAAIKENFRRVKKMQYRARRSRSEREPSRSSPATPNARDEGGEGNAVITPPRPSHSPSSPPGPESVVLHRETPSSSPLFESYEQDGSNALRNSTKIVTGPSQQTFDTNGLDPQEAYLLMYYLDQVFPWQFPYHNSRSRLGNRGWLFLLLIKRGPLYHAALSLSSLHQSAIIDTEEEFRQKQKALDHHSRALRELCDLMSEKGDKLGEDHAQLTEFLACSFMLISFEVCTYHETSFHLSNANRDSRFSAGQKMTG